MTPTTFKGRVCLVTGGTQGIGWAIAQALAAHGGTVYACGRSQENLQRAQQAQTDLLWGHRLHLAQCDVTDRGALEAWINAIYRAESRLDVLVNNAAYVHWADLRDMGVEDALLTMRVGYDAMVYAIYKALPLLEANGWGHIVNMGSIAGRIFVGGSSAAYAATKAAIDAFTQTLHVELRGSPVQTTLVRLGTVAGTDFFKKHVTNARMPALTRFMPALTPPQVADAVLQAIVQRKPILTLPRYLALLTLVYGFMPGVAQRLAGLGGQNLVEYGRVEWQYQQHPTDPTVPTPDN